MLQYFYADTSSHHHWIHRSLHHNKDTIEHFEDTSPSCALTFWLPSSEKSWKIKSGQILPPYLLTLYTFTIQSAEKSKKMKLRKSYLLTYLPIVCFCWEAERDKKKLSEKNLPPYLLTLHTFWIPSSYNREKKLSRENTYLLTYLPYLLLAPKLREILKNKVRTNLTFLLTYPVYLYYPERREIEKNEVTKILPHYLLTHRTFLLGSWER